MPTIPGQIVVRLDDSERAALTAILLTLAAPHRRPPSISDAVRFAISKASSAAL